MEVSASSFVVALTAIVVLYIWRVLSWLWFEPKRKEKFLRDHGLVGTSYRFMSGDLKEMSQMAYAAKSKPMSLTHDITLRVYPFFHKSFTTYGKNCFTWMGTQPVVHISEPILIREVLGKNYHYQKTWEVNPFVKFLLTGLVKADADQWNKHRKIINPAFHVNKIKHMVPAFHECCREMIHTWGELLKEKSSCEVDVWTYLQTFTSDAIARTAFGSSFEEGKRIFELEKEQAKLVTKALGSLYIPGSRFLPTKRNKRMNEINDEVNASIRSIIDKRIILMEAGETSNDDLLGVLLESNCKEIKQRGKSNFGLSIEEIVEECKIFYFAGHETTANLLVWTMILLGLHTDWQTRAREEVFHVFDKRKPDIDGLNRLKTISMILYEVLRLYPPAAVMKRQVHEETKLGSLTLPAETIVQLNTLFLHHDPDTWGDDANEFKPERFSEGVSKVTKGEASFIPFGAGPRICIGQNFAMQEVKMALSMILQCFSFELCPSYTHAPQVVITLQPQFGAPLILQKL